MTQRDPFDGRRYLRMTGGAMPDLFPGDMPDDILMCCIMLKPDVFDPADVAAATAGHDGIVVGGGMSIQLNCHPLMAAESLRGAADAIESSYREHAAEIAREN